MTPKTSSPEAAVAALNQSAPLAGGEWSRFITTALLSLMIFLFVYQGALNAGFQMIDDGTINWEVMQAAKADGILAEVKAAWYRPKILSGSRYAPGFYLYKLTAIHAFGLNPWFHHLSHLVLCWIGAILPLVAIGRVLRRDWIPYLGIALHAFVGDEGWSVHTWNMYDVSTYDPLATAAFTMACLAGWWLLVASGRVAVVLAAVASLLLFFAASHSKETTALICLSLLPLIPVLAWRDAARRRRWLLLWVMVLIPVALFFYGFRASGAMAASRADDYTKSYVVSGSVMFGNLKGILAYLLTLMGPLLIALLLFLAANFVRLALSLKRKERIDEYNRIALLLIYLFAMGILQAMPNTLLTGSPRFLYPAFVPMVMILSLMLAFPCRAWLVGLWPAQGSFVTARWVGRGATAALAALLVLAPLRLVSFNNFYNSYLAQEYRLAQWCEARFREDRSAQIAVIAWNDHSSFYWSIYNHLRNVGIEPQPERYIFVRRPQWSAPITPNAKAMPCIIFSRAAQFSQSLVGQPRILDSQPLPGNETVLYPNTRFASIWQWLGSKGAPPWSTRADRSGYRIGTYAFEPQNP